LSAISLRLRCVAELLHGRARDDAQAADSGERCQDLLVQAIGEIRVGWVGAQVVERQHGDARPLAEGRTDESLPCLLCAHREPRAERERDPERRDLPQRCRHRRVGDTVSRGRGADLATHAQAAQIERPRQGERDWKAENGCHDHRAYRPLRNPNSDDRARDLDRDPRSGRIPGRRPEDPATAELADQRHPDRSVDTCI
jgi:hypothetical protein